MTTDEKASGLRRLEAGLKGVIALAAGAALLFVLSSKVLNRQDDGATGVPASASILSLEKDPGRWWDRTDRTIHAAVLRVMPSDGAEFETRSEISGRYYRRASVGDRLTVWLDPARPTRVTLPQEARRETMFRRILLWVLPAVCCIGGLIYLRDAFTGRRAA